MVPKFYAVYSALVFLLFATATHQGYALTNIFAASHHHRPGANHYHK